MLEKATEVLRAKELEVLALREAERKMVAECVATKSSMPANYWQPRQRAEQQLQAAKQIVEALKEGQE